MSERKDEILAANEEFVAEFGDRANLDIPPARKIAILTCMDARLDPTNFAGLKEGDAHIIRNAGGRVSEDAIRSLAISHKLLGTNEWFVIHHSGCGMETFTDADMAEKFGDTDDKAEAAKAIDWLTITDREASVIEDVERLRNHPLVPSSIPIHGFIYEVETGRLVEVKAASEAGAAR